MAEPIIINDLIEHYDYCTTMDNCKDKFNKDMEYIRNFVLKNTDNQKLLSELRTGNLKQLADHLLRISYLQNPQNRIKELAGFIGTAAASSAGGAKTQRKYKKKFSLKKGGKKKINKTKNIKQNKKNKSVKNKNIKNKINNIKNKIKNIKKIKQNAGSDGATKPLSFGRLKKKIESVLNKIIKDKLSAFNTRLDNNSNPNPNPNSNPLIGSEINHELEDAETEFLRMINEDERRCLFSFKINVGGNEKSVMVKIAPFSPDNDFAGKSSILPGNEEGGIFNYNSTSSYYYEAEMYNEVNKTVESLEEGSVGSVVKDSVVKFYGFELKKISQSTDLNFTIKIGEQAYKIELPAQKIVPALRNLSANLSKPVKGFTFLFTEKEEGIQTIYDYVERKGDSEQEEFKKQIFAILPILYKQIGFVHYDLHGDNCLIKTDGSGRIKVKLFDFDLSQITINKDNNQPCEPTIAEAVNSKSILYDECETFVDILKQSVKKTEQEQERAIRLAGVLWDVYRVFNHWGFNESNNQLFSLEQFYNIDFFYKSDEPQYSDDDKSFKDALEKQKKDLYEKIKDICSVDDFDFLIQLLINLKKQDTISLKHDDKFKYWGIFKYNLLRAMPFPESFKLNNGIPVNLISPAPSEPSTPSSEINMNSLLEELNELEIIDQFNLSGIKNNSGINIKIISTGNEDRDLSQKSVLNLNEGDQLNIKVPQNAFNCQRMPQTVPAVSYEELEKLNSLSQFEVTQSN
jgi:hypothetical protein